jgi:hypothetical protein
MADQQAPQKKVVSIQGILNDLEAGLDRKAIRTKYGYTISEMKAIFSHEKLKFVRPKQPSAIEFLDDAPPVTAKVKKVKATTSTEGEEVETKNAAVTDTQQGATTVAASVQTVDEATASTDNSGVATSQGAW